MFKEALVDVLKRSCKAGVPSGEMMKAIAKIQGQKRLSSREFFAVYCLVWKEGPMVKYQSPDRWIGVLEGY